ncbi:WhiB family transcriptional regulator [Cellulomonas taurus]|uniref:WhiB family transcriptional regulator n=1 Tax=Cellulomonas taurus TaxID=2729175 RepID=UPI00145E769C|nr:WhiB family transcriptional regulator [Cellulomonas taurus]
MTRALCYPKNDPPVDLVEIDEHSPAEDIAAARALCGRCPLLERCSPTVKRMNVAGVAGGLTRAERVVWQDRHQVTVVDVDVIDATPARQLTAAMLDGLPDPAPGDLHPRVRDLVLRMTEAGMTADEIVTLLNREDVTDRTVKYLRRTYMKGWARVAS